MQDTAGHRFPLFFSDLEFIIKSPCKDTLACIKLHNALSKAVAYEVRANNPTVYEIQPNIGLIQPRKTVDICVWLTQGLLQISSSLQC